MRMERQTSPRLTHATPSVTQCEWKTRTLTPRNISDHGQLSFHCLAVNAFEFASRQQGGVRGPRED